MTKAITLMIDRQTDRQIDKQIDRQVDRQIDRQMDRQIQIYISFICSFVKCPTNILHQIINFWQKDALNFGKRSCNEGKFALF